ncbi:hypothetical protein N431DRAFT_21655 [Stipitochalara longipes BDJ]|nr:hypothetical protein N431DRAFT_21655 [Stipitochalara longipes BDJ]
MGGIWRMGGDDGVFAGWPTSHPGSRTRFSPWRPHSLCVGRRPQFGPRRSREAKCGTGAATPSTERGEAYCNRLRPATPRCESLSLEVAPMPKPLPTALRPRPCPCPCPRNSFPSFPRPPSQPSQAAAFASRVPSLHQLAGEFLPWFADRSRVPILAHSCPFLPILCERLVVQRVSSSPARLSIKESALEKCLGRYHDILQSHKPPSQATVTLLHLHSARRRYVLPSYTLLAVFRSLFDERSDSVTQPQRTVTDGFQGTSATANHLRNPYFRRHRWNTGTASSRIASFKAE